MVFKVGPSLISRIAMDPTVRNIAKLIYEILWGTIDYTCIQRRLVYQYRLASLDEIRDQREEVIN